MMKKTPESYVMRRNRHRQAVMLWQGQQIKVDAGIEPILTLVNKFSDIATVSSCIGNDKDDITNMGYVAFTGTNRAVIKALVDRLAVAAEGEPLQIEFDAKWNQGCIRWKSRDLNIACRVIGSL
jgi:hypothetical protein